MYLSFVFDQYDADSLTHGLVPDLDPLRPILFQPAEGKHRLEIARNWAVICVVYANPTAINQVTPEVAARKHAEPANCTGQSSVTVMATSAERDGGQIERKRGAVGDGMDHANPPVPAVGVLPVCQAGCCRGNSSRGTHLQRSLGRSSRAFVAENAKRC